MNLRIAEKQDDFQIRKLLNEVDMESMMRISLRTEPSFFDAMQTYYNSKTIILEDNQEIVGCGSVCERTVFLDSKPTTISYIHNLRIRGNNGARNLKKGYALLRELINTPVVITTILSDNKNAKKVLTSNKLGIPKYNKIGQLTFHSFISQSKKEIYDIPTESDLEEMIHFVNKKNRNTNFAPVFSEELIKTCKNLNVSDFRIYSKESKIKGIYALWNQQPFKQIYIHEYTGLVSKIRPIINHASKLIGYPQLPEPKTQLNGEHIAFFSGEESMLRYVHSDKDILWKGTTNTSKLPLKSVKTKFDVYRVLFSPESQQYYLESLEACLL